MSYKDFGLLLVTILLISVTLFSIYIELNDKIIKEQNIKTRLLVSEITHNTEYLTNTLFNERFTKANEFREKFRIARDYYAEFGIDANIDELKRTLNSGLENPKYEIYVADTNYTIIRASEPSQLGFNISFSKDRLLKRKQENKIGISRPYHIKANDRFMIFMDGFFKAADGDHVLQVAYTYDKNQERSNIENLLKDSNIINFNSRIIDKKDKERNIILFEKYPTLNYKTVDIQSKALEQILGDQNLVINENKNGKNIDLYMRIRSAIFTNLDIITYVKLNTTDRKIEQEMLLIRTIIVWIICTTFAIVVFSRRDKSKTTQSYLNEN